MTKESLSVFPNPAQNIVSWSFTLNTNVQTLTIFDLTGRPVSKLIAPESNVIDVSSLKSGIYFLELCDGKRRYQTKFSIVR